MPSWAVWIGVGIACVIAEIFTTGFFVFWFGIGAFLAAAASRWLDLPGQIVLFVASSFVLVISSRRIFGGLSGRAGEVRTNVDALIGTTGYVTEAISGDALPGKVKVGGEIWTAVSEGGMRIPEGAKVSVLRVEGVHLVVRAHDEPTAP
ncbi:MAG: NfeD family protein [Firmicutes bacterium]|nr:NfeD family protein [Candidatus Fermentithermobacillaceae bacterium]